MSYEIAGDLAEVTDRLAREPARLIAGGTDYFPAHRDGASHDTLLDVSRVPELRGIAADGAGWRIGGAVTWSEIVRADLPPAFDGLKAAAREVGSVQIQNVGTLAGNLCNASPAADGVPPLLTLGAEVALASARGLRRVPLADFITGPRQTIRASDEVLSAIHIPAQSPHVWGAFAKLGARRYLVISITMVAALLGCDRAGRIDHARIAIGACSPVARRQPGLEAALIGQDPAQVTVTPGHLHDLSPLDDVRADAGFRLTAAAAQCTDLIRAVGGQCAG